MTWLFKASLSCQWPERCFFLACHFSLQETGISKTSRCWPSKAVPWASSQPCLPPLQRLEVSGIKKDGSSFPALPPCSSKEGDCLCHGLGVSFGASAASPSRGVRQKGWLLMGRSRKVPKPWSLSWGFCAILIKGD